MTVVGRGKRCKWCAVPTYRVMAGMGDVTICAKCDQPPQ